MKPFLLLAVLAVAASVRLHADEPRLLATLELPAAMTDLSGEQGALDGGIPANQWGAFGSGIAWLGRGNQYAMISDRGPADGKSAFRCRYHVVEIDVQENAATPIKVTLLKTCLLSNRDGIPLVGSLDALPGVRNGRGVRFDPEAIRVTAKGSLLISDEYGPSILEFAANGRQIGQLKLPPRFLAEHPSADPRDEFPPGNRRGRQPNRGLESLAISADGTKVYSLLQSPLIQDCGVDAMNKRIGTNVRLLEVDRATGATREYLYPLDHPGHGCNEIEFVAPGRFLVIERDSKPGAEAEVKQIVEIDLRQATDISQIDSLPATEIPAGVVPVTKKLFLNLLDPRWKLAGATFPEKIEGIAIGPTRRDGSRVLLITSDNDFLPAPTHIYAFAVRFE